MGFYYDLCLLTFILSTVQSTILPAITKDWLIEFHQPVQPNVAKRIAKRYAMVSRGPVCDILIEKSFFEIVVFHQVLNDERLYHFVDLKPTHVQTRKKRDIVQEEFIQRNELVIKTLFCLLERILIMRRLNELFIKFLMFVPNVVIILLLNSKHRFQNINHQLIPIFNINGIW